jgi:predicted transposase YbfD/YdcC
MPTLNADDVTRILDYFKDLEDPRSTVNRRHLLGDVIVICVAAVIAGCDGPTAIGSWAATNHLWLQENLRLPNGIPSHDVIGRVLALLKPAAFQPCFQGWLDSLQDRGDDATAAESATPREQIAIDGKALRRSHDRRHSLGPLFLVSAWSVNRGISLGQLATEEKSNEITAIPELLDQIDVTAAIVTIDAAGCQRAIARKIIDGGGDYVLNLKGNQKTMHQEVKEYVAKHLENEFADVPARKYVEVVKGHGRVDTLTYYQMPVPTDLTQRKRWKKLRTIGVAVRISEQQGKETYDIRYYINSLRMGVRQFADSVRGHWSIENTLHWCLDMTFREDESRLRNQQAADNVAWLRRFALSALKQQNDKDSIAMRRRKAGWSLSYLAQVLGISKP